jgi:hypothetical protein
MNGWHVRRLSLLLPLLALACAGCVSVDYVGKTLPPTASVDVYLAASDVPRPYQVIGNASAEIEAIPFTNPAQQLQEKLVAEARSRGADGIILGGVDTREIPSTQQTIGQASSKKKGGKKSTQYTETTTTSTSEIKSLQGTLIKYTGP